MRMRSFAAAVSICSSALLAGCPLGFSPDSGSGSTSEVIPDGRYSGDTIGEVTVWEGDDIFDEGSEENWTDAAFRDGALLKDSGKKFRLNDWDQLESGAYVIARTVENISVGDWGYEITFDLQAEWNSIPMTGYEYAGYTLNNDGTVELFDEIELISLESYDGGLWLIHADSYGTLAADALRPAPAPTPAPTPTPTPTPQPQWPDLFDRKSG